jgi:hypothetical protein
MALLRRAGIDVEDASRMVGVISSSRPGFEEAALAAFVAVIAAHRVWERVV